MTAPKKQKAVILPPAPKRPGNNPNGHAETLTPGRSPNRAGVTIRNMVLSALNEAGGESYLLYQAFTNPQLFMPLVGRVIPTQVEGNPDEPLNVVHHYITRKAVPSPLSKKK